MERPVKKIGDRCMSARVPGGFLIGGRFFCPIDDQYRQWDGLLVQSQAKLFLNRRYEGLVYSAHWHRVHMGFLAAIVRFVVCHLSVRRPFKNEIVVARESRSVHDGLVHMHGEMVGYE